MRNNVVQPDRLPMTIWGMRIACWVPTATSIHADYVIPIVFHWNKGCTNATRCYVTHILPVFLILLAHISCKAVGNKVGMT